MRVIVITGIDGAGKSTLLSGLKTIGVQSSVLSFPHITLEPLQDDDALYEAAKCINQINHEADVMHLPQLKAVALLGAMLLFKPILDKENVLAKHLVFCERHPLIDTSIYASFYAQKLSPGSIDVAVLTTIERKYAKGFSAIKNYVPSIIHTSGMGICEAFMAFIYDWFHIKNRTSVLDLQEIFKVNLPNKVFYLKASPEFLFNRIKDRKLKEAHESYEVFVKLENVYQALFLSLNEQKEDLVALVNAESAEDMDAFSLKLKRGDI